MNATLQHIVTLKHAERKAIAILLDPDKATQSFTEAVIEQGKNGVIDYIFIGGSVLLSDQLHDLISFVKQSATVPVIIFPGSNMHIDEAADAILLLSLISGRNPDLLIGQHVTAAPILKKSKLDILSTGYILIDGGTTTTVGYISNTNPIPNHKPALAACTAIAGELLGQQLIYLDSGSGAQHSVSAKVIKQVRQQVDVPVIVGGGIRSLNEIQTAHNAGADIVVIGNHLEENPEFLNELVTVRSK